MKQLPLSCQIEDLIKTLLGVSDRLAACLAESPHPSRKEMKQRFEKGRLPCSFSDQLLWDPLLPRLTRLETDQTRIRQSIAEQQQKRREAAQGAFRVQRDIKALHLELAAFSKAEQFHSNQEDELLSELNQLKTLDINSLARFIKSAAQVEKELVKQLEAQLVQDRDELSALHEKRSPKLSLLLNCFGANEETIQALEQFKSVDLTTLSVEELKPFLTDLPREQQIVVLYTQERLVNGKLPLSDHDCALCDCETAEQMAAFLNEHGLLRVTAELIHSTGAIGRGALLFLSPKELQMDNGALDQMAFTRSRAGHRKA